MQLSSEGKQLVEYALTSRAWTLEKLSEESGLGISTVKNFNARKTVSRITFVTLCEKLGVDWQTASSEASPSIESESSDSSGDRPQIQPQLTDDLLQQVREHCRQKILSQHSRMQLLSGEEIGVDQLYVDVWVLNRSPRTFQVSQSKLLETFDLRHDRLGLGDRIRRNPGFEVANKNSRLVILGKPGSGKTTFLKHLAMDWCKEQFQPQLTIVVIEFRWVRGEQWHLIDVIGEELGLGYGQQIRILKDQIESLKKEPIVYPSTPESVQQKDKKIEGLCQQLNALPLQVFLTEGRLLVLMDGLDEVSTDALRGEVRRQLHAITEEYPKNRFILTCRTQIMASIPIGFTSVEVADFSPEQVQQFVQNWFLVNGKSDAEAAQQWETLSTSANNNPALKELMVTPVLLSLMCLVLQDEGEISSEIAWLYQKGIKLLLSRWNEDKQITEWEMGSETYRQLSVREKEELLIKIAARKFENPNNFVLFEQEEIVAEIADFLQLSHPREGVVALKAIEAQHGLLIERADELWSFSHLTFQEYFTVQWLIQLSPEDLGEKVANRQWQEVVRQLVQSQQPADRLLRLIKQAVDRLLANEPIANRFLTWALQKAESIQARYGLSAIRAFYFALDRDRDNLAFTLARDIDTDIALHIALVLARDIDRDLALDLALDFALDRDLDLALALALDRDLDLDLDLDRAFSLDLDRALDRAHNYTSKLVKELTELRAALPTDSCEVLQWWKIKGIPWTQQLRQVMIEHRNIGHNWQFTNAQKQQLQRYYDANKFLVDLMNIEGAVSDSVRAEIEDTLLLPWDELQRRQPEVYGQSQIE